MNRMIPLAAACAIAACASPGTAGAAPYKYKVDVSIVQKADWEQTVRTPRDGYCNNDVHYLYKGSGDADLTAKGRGRRTTFRRSGGIMQSTEIRVPGEVISDGAWSMARQNDPPPDCDVPPPPAFDPNAGLCNPLVRKKGTARIFLMVQRGRLVLTGALALRDPKQACGDPSTYSGVLGVAGPSKQRRDVGDLIRSKRTKSIELSARFNGPLMKDDLIDGFGANAPSVTGSGNGTARWNVKLTRVR